MGEIKPQPKRNNIYIIGINIAILAGYTLISKMVEGGFLFDAFFIFVQVFVCFILAISNNKGVWVLAALIVLLIGFSSCVSFLAGGM